MRGGITRRIIFIALAIVLAGCRYDPYAREFAREKPDSAMLVGTYALASRPSAKIILNADQTFVAAGIPDEAITLDGVSRGETLSGTGSWKLFRKQDQWWSVVLGFQSLKYSSGGHKEDYGLEVNLVGDKPPYTLHFTVGDPDSGNALQFKK